MQVFWPNTRALKNLVENQPIAKLGLASLCATGLVWLARACSLYALDASTFASFALSIVILVSNVFAVFLLLNVMRSQFARQHSKIQRAAVALATTLVFTGLQVLPLAPDTYALLSHEAPGKQWFFILLAYVLVVPAVSLLRALPVFAGLFLLERNTGRSFVSGLTALGTYFGLAITEAIGFVLFPMIYWTSLALPLVPMKNHVAFDFSQVGQHVFVLVDPQITDARRIAIYQEGLPAFRKVGVLLAQQIQKQDLRPDVKELFVILPETTFFMGHGEFDVLYSELSAQLVKAGFGAKVHFLAGALHDFNNVTFYAGEDPLTGRMRRGIVSRKTDLVPFFERDSLGLSVSAIQEPVALSFDEYIFLGQTSALPGGLTRATFDICYEALNLSRWQLGQSKIVLTNHSLFSHFKIMSQIYDLNLRLLGRVFDAPLVLVGNQGTTGAFVPHQDAAERLGKIFQPDSFEQWSFVKLSLPL